MTGRVLIVEDDPEVLALERDLLEEDLGLVADGVTTLREALDMVRLDRPDLIILDLRLPDGDGIAVLNALRDDPRLETVPVMVVTAMTGYATRNRVKAAGATDIMYKPFDAEAFLQHVVSILSKASGPSYSEPSGEPHRSL